MSFLHNWGKQSGKGYYRAMMILIKHLCHFSSRPGLSRVGHHRFLKKLYQGDYDERLTSQMYERAKNKISNGEQVRGAGSFIFTLKVKGLNDLLRLANIISGTRANEAEHRLRP